MVTSGQVKEKYLKFFEERGHKIIPPAPLVLENDPTTLFTSSGMQPLVPYLMGKKHELGTRLVDSQPSVRAQGKNDDILEVGDNRHLTLFEMLGNWSLGDYFKEEQLPWIYEFYTEELKIPKNKIYVSIFEGNADVAEDIESFNIWKKIGVLEDHIYSYNAKKNWWSRSGPPDEMAIGDIGGPSSEIFYEFDSIKHDKKFGEKCHPNCDCGRFLEIGNCVFITYKKLANGNLEELPQKNVDFGGGWERITAASNNDPDVFKTDIFWPFIEKLVKFTGVLYEDNINNYRIYADHLRASLALIDNGVIPSNKMHGYVLRRLIRRMAIKFPEVDKVIDNPIILEELKKFRITLDKGLREINKVENITGKIAFDLYQSYGFPLELTVELFEDKGQEVNLEEFKKEFEKHKEASKSLSTGIFKGGLEDHSEETTKLHTLTHLLHASLRKVLGDGVSQKGSHITHERLRFDFSYPQKLTEEQTQVVIDLINEKIDEGLDVTFVETTPEEAIKMGALHFFAEKYGEKVKVYTIGPHDNFFSKEICGGPHVTNTKLLRRAKIIKQEKIGSGIIRIYVGLSKET